MIGNIRIAILETRGEGLHRLILVLGHRNQKTRILDIPHQLKVQMPGVLLKTHLNYTLGEQEAILDIRVLLIHIIVTAVDCHLVAIGVGQLSQPRVVSEDFVVKLDVHLVAEHVVNVLGVFDQVV